MPPSAVFFLYFLTGFYNRGGPCSVVRLFLFSVCGRTFDRDVPAPHLAVEVVFPVLVFRTISCRRRLFLFPYFLTGFYNRGGPCSAVRLFLFSMCVAEFLKEMRRHRSLPRKSSSPYWCFAQFHAAVGGSFAFVS